MYDILFICKHCGVHLSAEDNDVGISLPCPDCSEELSVPTGDILFHCPECGKALLASSESRLQYFHCPDCESEVVVPAEGKHIAIAEPTQEPPPKSMPTVPPAEKTAMPSRPEAGDPERRQHDQFMTSWGDYLAKAGLTEDEKS